VSTDLETAGLSTTKLSSRTRDWLITIDFEAFSPSDVDLWSKAMLEWAECAWSAELPFAVFVALEDVAMLRAANPAGYARFLSAARAMHDAGCVFHPHNHQFFDDETGTRPRIVGEGDARSPGYRKRTSFYFDVVHREGYRLRSWLGVLEASYRRFLTEMRVPVPNRRAFRAGGWDNGSTTAELSDYVESLTAFGYTYDSSATAGEFATSTWKIGAPYGENVFGLRGGITEVAPTFSLHCGTSLLTADGLRNVYAGVAGSSALAARPKPGVIATVLHFDHLFHAKVQGRFHPFVVKDQATIVRRIHAHFRALVQLRRLLRVHRVIEFAELALIARDASTDCPTPLVARSLQSPERDMQIRM
jgi:hypothetical protein